MLYATFWIVPMLWDSQEEHDTNSGILLQTTFALLPPAKACLSTGVCSRCLMVHTRPSELLVFMNRSTSWRSLATMFKVTDSTFRGRLCRQHLGLFPWISTSLSINRADGREGSHADPQVASMASMHQSFSPFFFSRKSVNFSVFLLSQGSAYAERITNPRAITVRNFLEELNSNGCHVNEDRAGLTYFGWLGSKIPAGPFERIFTETYLTRVDQRQGLRFEGPNAMNSEGGRYVDPVFFHQIFIISKFGVTFAFSNSGSLHFLSQIDAERWSS